MTTPDRRADDTSTIEPGVGSGMPGGRGTVTTTAGLWNAAELRTEIDAAAAARRAPVVMAAMTAGVGVGAWSVAQVAAALGGPDTWSAVCALVWAGTAVAVPALRGVYRGRIPQRWARTWWVATCSAAVWIDVVAVQGAALLTPAVGIGSAAILVLGAATLGARWADEHEVPNPTPAAEPDTVPGPAPAEPPPPDVDTTAAAIIERDWDDEVAHGQNPIAPESTLTARTALPHGWWWLVHLDRGGSVGCTELEQDGVTSRVALKLGVRSTHVMLERLDGPDDREDLAQLTVVTRDVLAAGVPYRGPRYRDGLVPIGDYADGTPDAPWRAYDQTGVLCGLVTGGQGSGKSALMAALGMALRRSGEWTVLFGDGDEGGNSSLLLAEVAHDFARGPAEVLQQLEGLEAMAQVRGTLMGTLTTGPDGNPTPITRAGQRPVTKMLPCRAYPGVVWIVDEFYRLANDPHLQAVQFVDRVEAIVRIMRKYGGCVIVGTQSALGDDFDGNSALRGMLASGNSAVLRTKNKSEQGIVTDGFAPSALPKGGGYAFLGEGDRRAMIRTEHPDGMPQWVPDVVRFGRPDDRSWAAFRRYRQVRELDQEADYAEQLAKLVAFDEAVATGAPLPWAAETRGGEDGHDMAGTPVTVAGFAVPTLADVIPLHPAAGEDPDKEQAAADPPALSRTARLVLDTLRSRPGAWRSAELIDRTGLSASAVSKALRELVDHGVAHKPSGVRGVHAAGPAPEINSEGAI